jgi:NAD-dependent dihydropyrimidine dehydrogenase PreA subunit
MAPCDFSDVLAPRPALPSPRNLAIRSVIVAFVITDNCIKDELCVQACPVDCIHPRNDESGFEAATQVYVDPAECIDCGACIPACTSDAIFPLDEVPAEKRQFIAINEAFFAAS